jgi:hypothetical protein
VDIFVGYTKKNLAIPVSATCKIRQKIPQMAKNAPNLVTLGSMHCLCFIFMIGIGESSFERKSCHGDTDGKKT